jgi:hypothetical protein
MKRYLLVILLFITACAPPAPATTPGIVTAYATNGAQPWLARLYACGASQSVLVRRSDSPTDADLVLRVGEPASLSTPAFQIGSEDVLVVVNQARASQVLSVKQVSGLFTGQITDWRAISPSQTGQVQVWVFAQGEDVQQVFAQTLGERPVVSGARLAASPAEMSQAIANDANAIGILTRQWKPANVADVFTAATIPVLAIAPAEPVGAVKDLLACLQG